MAKLGDTQAAAVAASTNPNALADEGIYLATLTSEVKTFDAKSPGGSVTWVWPFTIDAVNEKGEPQPSAGKKLDHRTWLSDAAFYRLKATFDAFGVSTSTETDDLLNHKVRIKVIVKDDYRGEIDDETGLVKLVNDIKDVLPADGPTGIDEAAKARREARQKAAKEELASNPATTADNELLF